MGIIGIALAVIHSLGLISAVDALLVARTSQSAIAWSFALIGVPYISLPAYWIFGRTRFKGYREIVANFTRQYRTTVSAFYRTLSEHASHDVPVSAETKALLERLAKTHFVDGNKLELLVNGESTFNVIFEAIENAKKLIAIEFYIIRGDDLGKRFSKALIEAVTRGVRVEIVYDEVGSSALAESYVDELREAGVFIHAFGTRSGRGNFLQLNFRNHRKLVVVDDTIAIVGGLNIGEEYLGKTKRFPVWRDTAVKIEGPASLSVLEVFFSDRLWATKQPLELKYDEPKVFGSDPALIVATGPADSHDECTLFIMELIESAKERLWISTPYFVPTEPISESLRRAALKGVDVRIILPNVADQLPVYFASYVYEEELLKSFVRFFRYQPGFSHQKVILVDSKLASIGTVNIDTRSLRLNFEMSVVVASEKFAKEVELMLEEDFANSKEESLADLQQRGITKKVCSRLASLFSPIL